MIESIIHLTCTVFLFIGIFLMLKGGMNQDNRLIGGLAVMIVTTVVHGPLVESINKGDNLVEQLVQMEYETRYGQAPALSLQFAMQEEIKRDMQDEFEMLISQESASQQAEVPGNTITAPEAAQ
jgi:hypothetical protein